MLLYKKIAGSIIKPSFVIILKTLKGILVFSCFHYANNNH